MHQSPFTRSEPYGRLWEQNRWLLARRILPIIGACGLIYWLEGGIPPNSWTQLVQVWTHISVLWASNGSSVLLSVTLLTVQAFCVALAWGCLIWLVVRLIRAWRSSAVSLSTTPVPNARPVAKVTESAFPVSPVREQEPLVVLLQSPSLEYPFEPTLSEPQSAMSPIPPATQQAEKKTPPLPLSVPIHVNNSLDINHDVINPFQPGIAANDPLIHIPSQKPAAATNADITLQPPLDQTMMHDPTYTSAAAIPPAYIPQSQSVSTDDDDDSFAFGNPFEGPLPDVFYEDNAQRKSLIEQTGQVIEPSGDPKKNKKRR